MQDLVMAINPDGSNGESITLENFIAMNKQGALTGRYRNVPNEVYHRELPHLSNTDLGKILRSIAHFNEHKENPPGTTPAFTLGRAFHESILEPEIFAKTWTVMPRFDPIPGKTIKEQKEEWTAAQDAQELEEEMPKFAVIKGITKKFQEEEWLQKNTMELLSADDFEAVKKMAVRSLAHPVLGEILTDGVAEDVFLAIDPRTKLPVKVKADFLRNDGGVNLDLKSTQDGSFFEFQKSIANFNYHRQMSFYSFVIGLVTGKNPEHNILAAVEKKAPHEISIYRLDTASLEVGEKQWTRALDKFAEYRDENQVEGNAWAGYPLEICDMNLPAWSFNREGDL